MRVNQICAVITSYSTKFQCTSYSRKVLSMNIITKLLSYLTLLYSTYSPLYCEELFCFTHFDYCVITNIIKDVIFHVVRPKLISIKYYDRITYLLSTDLCEA